MELSLQQKVEGFLSKSQYLTFSLEKRPYLINFLFDNKHYQVFKKPKHFKNVVEYFKNRRMKLVIVTYNENTTISFVDIDTADTLNIEGVKFVDGNIHKFFHLNPPKNTMFTLNMTGKSADNETIIIPEQITTAQIKIHGYSVTDKRSAQ